jgi:hypothetical protein
MPKYKVELPSGTYQIEADDEGQLEAAISELGGQSGPKAPTSDTAQMFNRGMTAGLSDYPAAAGKYVGDKIGGALLNATGKQRTLADLVAPSRPNVGNKSFEQSLQEVRAGNTAFRDESPVLAYGAEIAGGIASPIFRGVAKGTQYGMDKAAQFLGKTVPKYVGYGFQGGAAGLTGGIGGAQNEQGGVPSLGDVAEQGGVGAALGGALGVSIPAGIEVGRKVINSTVQPVLDRVAKSGPVNAAARRTLDYLESRGLTPQQLQAKMNVRNADGQGMIADVLPELADDAAQFRGAAQTAASRNLTSRQGTIMSPSGQGDRLSESVFKNLSGDDFLTTIDDLQKARTVDAGPKYDAAFAEQTGPATTRSRQITSPTIERLLEDDDIQKGIATGVKLLQKESSVTGAPVNLADYALKRNAQGQFERVGTPTLRLLDAAKRGIDDMLFNGDGFRNQFGKLTQMGRALENQRAALVSEMDRLTVDQSGKSIYKAARDAWAGPSRSLDMMQRGRDFIKEGGADETTAFFKGLGESEREFYRIGVAKQLREMIETSADEANKAKKIFGSDAMRTKLEAIFPSRKAFNEFRKSVLLEMERSNTKQTVIGGSPTAKRLAGRDQFEMDPSGPLIDMATGNPRQGAVGFLRQAARALNAPPKSTAEQLAVLFSRDPAEQTKFIQSLDNRAMASRLLSQKPLPRDLLSRAGVPLFGSSNQ